MQKKDMEHEFVKRELSALMELTIRLEDELNTLSMNEEGD